MKFVNTILLSALSLGVVAQEPKNVIMVVGDGMGPAYTTAYRYFADDKNTLDVEQTVFDRMLVGMASTYPARISGYVTDSAAGATALATGVKSYNGAIAVNVDKKPVSTVLEWAKEHGMKTGVAVTSQINHATPAGYSAHNESRKNYDQIADSYFDEKINDHFVLDVMLGGGWDYFIRDDRNLVAEFKKAGYQYVDNIAHLKTANSKQPLLGLFAEQGLNWALDMPPKQRLKTLTQAAVEHLENDQGFFLLVEASQIDWAGHSNDVGAAMSEMQDLAQTMTWLEQYVDAHPDTLLVLTADHSTGGFTIGANKIYRWEPQWVDNLQASPYAIAKQLMSAEKKSALAAELLGFSLNEEEKSKIEAIDTQDEEIAYQTVKTLLDVRTNTGWTTGGHTGVDVPVFAKGPGSEMFRGMLNNTQVADNIFSLLGRK
ncbi:alkaline phosphatase [Paraglaciecola sp. Hal342]|jgi:alkaline phosphatase